MKKIWTLAVIAALGISTIGCGETAPAPVKPAAKPAEGEMTSEKPAETTPPAEGEKPADKPAEGEKPAETTPPAEAPK